MNGQLRITKRCWKHFENSLDPLTKEPYKIGDTVVKCSACKLTFHAEYLEEGKCPCCRKDFVPGSIETGVIRLGFDSDAARRGGKSVLTVKKWWQQADFAGTSARILTQMGIFGVGLSVGLLGWVILQSGSGWDGFVWQMENVIKAGAASRLQQAGKALIESLSGLRDEFEAVGTRLMLFAEEMERIVQATGASAEELIRRFSELG